MVNSPVLPTSDTNTNQRNSQDLAEIPSQIVSKVEKIEAGERHPLSAMWNGCWKWIGIYARKFGGLHEQRPNRLPWHEYIWSFIGALLGIAAVAFFHFRLLER